VARRSAFLLVAALAAAALEPCPGRCQQPGARDDSGTVRAVVRDREGAPIPYAVVGLLPGPEARFTDEAGTLVFRGVAPGTYRLLARQVGFRPRDSTVSVAAGATRVITLHLERLAVQLAAIKVVATSACTDPGLPDSLASPDLARLFYQLKLNAERYRLLARSYPFHFRMARTFNEYSSAGTVASTSTDTVRYLSAAGSGYQPGQVVRWGRGRGNTRGLVLNLPTLADFADTTFQASHCFVYGGVVGDSGAPAARFQFRPTVSIRTPDIEGYVDLDPVTYQVRQALVRLTHPGRALEGLMAARSVITFAELYPSIVVQSRVASEEVPAVPLVARSGIVRYTEDQRLLDVQFEQPLPGLTTQPERRGPGHRALSGAAPMTGGDLPSATAAAARRAARR
jgi:Carboxypeptidase regulatory-like domain